MLELPIRACAVVSSSDDVHQVLKAISQNIPHADVAVGKTQSNAEGNDLMLTVISLSLPSRFPRKICMVFYRNGTSVGGYGS